MLCSYKITICFVFPEHFMWSSLGCDDNQKYNSGFNRSIFPQQVLKAAILDNSMIEEKKKCLFIGTCPEAYIWINYFLSVISDIYPRASSVSSRKVWWHVKLNARERPQFVFGRRLGGWALALTAPGTLSLHGCGSEFCHLFHATTAKNVNHSRAHGNASPSRARRMPKTGVAMREFPHLTPLLLPSSLTERKENKKTLCLDRTGCLATRRRGTTTLNHSGSSGHGH